MPCEPCKIKVNKLLPCGHTKGLPCHQEPASANCLEIIPTKHPDCDHLINKPCYMDITCCHCREKCPFRLPCGHACERTCHVKDDYDHIVVSELGIHIFEKKWLYLYILFNYQAVCFGKSHTHISWNRLVVPFFSSSAKVTSH